MSETKKPRLAATVILLRPSENQSFEVFLTRRPDSMPFLGGMYCFPGGTLHQEDCAEAIQRYCHGLTPTQARDILGAHLSPREALGLWVATVRELFEETGVLLTRGNSGDSSQDVARMHNSLLAKLISFPALLAKHYLGLDLSALGYFSCWQTPSQFPMRFDTRFFVAVLPAHQIPLETSPEVAHSLWLTPDRALHLFAKDELPIIFPTYASLRTLADFTTLESVRKQYMNPAR